MNKDDLKELTFYHWIETTDSSLLDDICFIIDINTTSSPGNYQCSGIEIESLKGDLIIGHSYNYHFIWDKERAKKINLKYKIQKVNFNKINRKAFFDMIFDIDSIMFHNIILYKKYLIK